MLYDKKWEKTELDAIGRVLLDAADHMEQRGWCTNFTEDKYGRVCMVGAIRLALGLKTFPEDGHSLDILSYFSRVEKMLDTTITDWNDTKCTGKEHAVATLRAAACNH